MAVKKSKRRKDKAFYTVLAVLCLGFIVPATLPGTLPAYIAFLSAVGSLTGLYFGANVVQKKFTQPSYIKELELQQDKQDEENLGGAF